MHSVCPLVAIACCAAENGPANQRTHRPLQSLTHRTGRRRHENRSAISWPGHRRSSGRPPHPEWKTHETFASLLKANPAQQAAKKGVLSIVATTHTGMTTEEFSATVRDWIAAAKHPATGRLFTDMVYQLMLELLAYLARTASRPSSCPAAAAKSCARGPRRLRRSTGADVGRPAS